MADERGTWDRIKDFVTAPGKALNQAASTGEQPSGASPNTLQGQDPTYMMKQIAQQGAIQARQAAEASRNATSKGGKTPTPITVQKKGAKVPPPNPQDIMAAPRGK